MICCFPNSIPFYFTFHVYCYNLYPSIYIHIQSKYLSIFYRWRIHHVDSMASVVVSSNDT
jgi:hypothetical protein